MKFRIRSSVVVIHNDCLLAFRAKDPSSGREYLFLPGGEIEENETPLQTSVRETLEETGYQISVDAESAIDKDYQFHWNSEDYSCTTIFYRGKLINPFRSPEKVEDVGYNLGVVWVPKSEVSEKFNYTPEILDAILNLIDYE